MSGDYTIVAQCPRCDIILSTTQPLPKCINCAVQLVPWPAAPGAGSVQDPFVNGTLTSSEVPGEMAAAPLADEPPYPILDHPLIIRMLEEEPDGDFTWYSEAVFSDESSTGEATFSDRGAPVPSPPFPDSPTLSDETMAHGNQGGEKDDEAGEIAMVRENLIKEPGGESGGADPNTIQPWILEVDSTGQPSSLDVRGGDSNTGKDEDGDVPTRA
ncbi:hypothetical protein DCS_00956 [Drechmeria coniospora]|uniref:Uncharacterized protein n=1 Tax=Drechmeria coniospora TaxID=98403 RepID=A0A151GS36_DRECN|nr:hypothetical protein DCS_00956 [Drechmeria coniospora]KYK59822.1 hypothetical protein DCS_00956 [Drechmeria coniospora]